VNTVTEYTFNNTIYQITQDSFGFSEYLEWPSTNQCYWNNVVHTVGGFAFISEAARADGQPLLPAYSDYNCFYPSTLRFRRNRWATGDTAYNSLALWQAGTGLDQHSISADPLFVNAAAGDFHLQAGSPCVHAAYDRLGLSPGYASGAPDMGAYPRGNDGTVIGILPAGAPTITITAPGGTGAYTTTNATVNLAGSANDNVGVTSIAWTNAANGGHGSVAGGTSWAINGVALADGANAITVRAFDGDGNVGSATIEVTRWTPAVNQPPVANAGVNQSVTRGAVVSLNGTGSSDPDARPSPLTYAWTQTAGTTVTLSAANTATASFTGSADGVLTFRLTVSDGAASDTDDVTVTVNPPGNLAPPATGANDRNATVGTLVTLAGSGNDSDGTIVSYLWTQTAGASITLNNGNTATATFTPSQSGAYFFRLTVTDNQGATGTDTVAITVQPEPEDNQAPVPDAGDDETVETGDVVRLDAAGSSDPDGNALTFVWAQLSGPSATLESAGGAVAIFVASESGTYVFRVTVSDGLLTAQDDVTIAAEEGGTGQTGDIQENLVVVPNRTSLEDLAAVNVVGPVSLAGDALVYGVAGNTVGAITLDDLGARAQGTLAGLPALHAGLYIIVAGDARVRLVVTP
jgi:hypothetical protein